MTKNIVIGALLVICVWMSMSYVRNSLAKKQLIEALGNNNRVLIGKAKDIRKLESKNDTLLRELQKELDNKVTSATIVKQVIRDTVYLSAPTITKWDTINNIAYPVYEDRYEDRWTTIDARMGRDSSRFIYSIRNKIVVAQKLEREGMFKPRYLAVEIKNMNPHVSSEDYRSFHVPQRKPNRLLWMGIGFATGVGIMIAR